MVVVKFGLGQEGVPHLSLAEVLLCILDFEVLLCQQFVERFLDVHRFELFLNF